MSQTNKNSDADGVQELASKLEAICARLSGSFYNERGPDGRALVPNMMYLQSIGWTIGQDLEIIKNPSQQKTSDELPISVENIRAGIYRPIIVHRDPIKAPFRSDHYGYSNSQHSRVVSQDALTLYELLLSQLPSEIGPRTHVPREERLPLLVYAFHIILDDHEHYFDNRTRFRTFAAQHKYPFDNAVIQQAKTFLTDLKALADFPLESLLSKYIETVRNANKEETENNVRQLSPYCLFLDRSFRLRSERESRSMFDEEEVSVDPLQYEHVLKLRDDIVQFMKSAKNWSEEDMLEAIANFYYESNPWNYLVYFEVTPSQYANRVADFIPSKRREEPVYVDYTGNLQKVKNWMGAVLEGKPISHLALIGPAGTGKTGALLRAAQEYAIKIVNVDLQIVTDGYLPSVIQQARNMSQHPFVIYIDNIDVPPELEENRPMMLYYFVNNLERQMEGPTALGGRVKFAMSTSTYDGLPPALRQRFNTRLDFPKPPMDQQYRVMAAHLEHLKINASPDEVLKHVYGVENLDAVTEEKYKTPRELKDGALDFTFQKL